MADAGKSLLDEAIRIAVLIDEVADQHSAWVRDRLLELRAEIIALIAKADPTEPSRLVFRQQRIEEIIRAANDLISTVFVAIRKRTEQVLTAVAETSQSSFSSVVASLLLIKGLSALLKRKELKDKAVQTEASGATVTSWLARQSGDMQFRLERTLRDAMATQDVSKVTLDSLVAAVRGPDIGPGGIFKVPLRNADNLIRTAVHAVANRVRVDTITSHPELFKGFVHVSVIDSKTTDICRPRDGLKWTLEGDPIGHSKTFRTPPLHFRCRSHLSPIMLAHADLPAKLKKRTDPAGFTGKPAPDVNDLDSWLREQDANVDQAKLMKTWRKVLKDLMPNED